MIHLTSRVKETGELEEMCLKRTWFSFISLLTPKVNVVGLNSRIPLTCVNLIRTQSRGILSQGPANYWLITSSDTGHSQSQCQNINMSSSLLTETEPKPDFGWFAELRQKILSWAVLELVLHGGGDAFVCLRWWFSHHKISSNDSFISLYWRLLYQAWKWEKGCIFPFLHKYS